MRTLPKIASSLTAIALIFGIGSAQAALVNFTLSGKVDILAQTGNVFGLNMNDTVSVVGIFDDNVLSGGTGDVSFNASSSSNNVTVTVGGYSFTKVNDIDYGGGHYPTISLTNGVIVDFDFVAPVETIGSFDSLGMRFDAYGDNNQVISGSWTPATFLMTPASAVPVPAAAWLFGTGLLGLVGIARRKVAA